MTDLRTNAKRALWVLRIATLLFYALAMLYMLLDYVPGVALLRSAAVVAPLALAALALREGTLRRPVYWIGFAFAAWYGLTRALMGRSVLSFALYHVFALCAVFGLAFPFAAMQRDGDERAASVVLGVLTTIIGALAWLSILCACTGTLAFLGTNGTFGILRLGQSGGNYIFMGQNKNFTAALMIAGVFMSLYLWVSRRGKPTAVLGGLCFVGCYAALGMTQSRSARVLLAAFAAMLVGLLYARSRFWRGRLRLLRLAAVFVAACVAVYAGFSWSVDVITRMAAQNTAQAETLPTPSPQPEAGGSVPRKELNLDTIVTLSNRLPIYRATLQIVADEPGILLTGMNETSIPSRLRQYLGHEQSHTHNAYLQTLLITGLPGLLMALLMTAMMARMGIRLFFSRQPEATLADRVLAVAVGAMFLHSMMEHYLFVDNYSILNLLFFLMAGYVVERGTRLEPLFPRVKKAKGRMRTDS